MPDGNLSTSANLLSLRGISYQTVYKFENKHFLSAGGHMGPPLQCNEKNIQNIIIIN